MQDLIKTPEPVSGESGEPLFDLAKWLGQREAFGLIGGRCSASEVETLRPMRDERRYEQTGLNWDEFCTKHLHAARRSVDREIGFCGSMARYSS